MDEFNQDMGSSFPDPTEPHRTPPPPERQEQPVAPEDDWGIPPRPPLPERDDYGGMPQQNSVPPQGGWNASQNLYGGSYPPPPPPPTVMHYVPQYSYPAVPPVPKETVIPMNRRIYTMAAVVAVLVFLLCVYCIGSDILHGALSGGTEVRNVTVELITQEKPDLDPNDENVTPDGAYTVKGVAELVTPSIVEVYTYGNESRISRYLEGTGSGIIISDDGYIVTNAHVVDGEAFSVVLYDEREFEAELVGSDHKTDLAILKIRASGLVPAVLGNSDETYIGEEVVAIGNPAGLTNTVTKGIVSAINRQIRAENNAFMMDCIQTDAAISPGNSGGALVNMYGQVIGITSSKYASQYSSAYEGLGFAITMNEALPVLTDLMENGYVANRFRIGITFTEMNGMYIEEEFLAMYGITMPEELEGSLWISEVSEECDISNTDLQPNDFIVEMEGKPVAGYDDVLGVLEGYKGGDMVTARCARVEDGEVVYFEITFMLEEDTSGNY